MDGKLIVLCDGKYGVINHNGRLEIHRHHKRWKEKEVSYIGDGFVLALVHKIEELEARLSEKYKEEKVSDCSGCEYMDGDCISNFAKCNIYSDKRYVDKKQEVAENAWNTHNDPVKEEMLEALISVVRTIKAFQNNIKHDHCVKAIEKATGKKIEEVLA